MKKWIALLLAVSALMSLTACGKNQLPEETEMLMTEPSAASESDDIVVTLDDSFFEDPQESEEESETAEADPEISQETETVPGETETAPEETESEFDLPDGFEAMDEIVYPLRSVNIRTRPNVYSNSLGRLLRGEPVRRVGANDQWSAVIHDDKLCYIASEYLTRDDPVDRTEGSLDSSKNVTEDPSSGTVYANRRVNLRQGPGTDTPRLDSIPYAAKMERLAVCSNGWVKVDYEGTIGYVAGKYLTRKKPPEAKPRPTDPPETTAPQDPTDSPETTVPENPTVPETTESQNPPTVPETTESQNPPTVPETTESKEPSVPSEPVVPPETKEPQKPSVPSDD